MSRPIEPYGTSTVAMSAYNLLAAKGEGADAEEILKVLQMLQHPALEAPLLERALGRLVAMKAVARLEGGEYKALGRPGCVVVGRWVNDYNVNQETGEVEGGWTRWVARTPESRLLPFSEVMKP